MGPYVDTSTIVIPRLLSTLLRVLWGYQDYHSIHHLFPKVPFYRYRRLFNEIADRMDQMGAPVYRLTWAAPH
jgi:beta-carotene hydroxylase